MIFRIGDDDSAEQILLSPVPSNRLFASINTMIDENIKSDFWDAIRFNKISCGGKQYQNIGGIAQELKGKIPLLKAAVPRVFEIKELSDKVRAGYRLFSANRELLSLIAYPVKHYAARNHYIGRCDDFLVEYFINPITYREEYKLTPDIDLPSNKIDRQFVTSELDNDDLNQLTNMIWNDLSSRIVKQQGCPATKSQSKIFQYRLELFIRNFAKEGS